MVVVVDLLVLVGSVAGVVLVEVVVDWVASGPGALVVVVVDLVYLLNIRLIYWSWE